MVSHSTCHLTRFFSYLHAHHRMNPESGSSLVGGLRGQRVWVIRIEGVPFNLSFDAIFFHIYRHHLNQFWIAGERSENPGVPSTSLLIDGVPFNLSFDALISACPHRMIPKIRIPVYEFESWWAEIRVREVKLSGIKGTLIDGVPFNLSFGTLYS